MWERILWSSLASLSAHYCKHFKEFKELHDFSVVTRFLPHLCPFQRAQRMALPLLLIIFHLCCSPVGWTAGSDSDKYNCNLTARQNGHLINMRMQILHICFQYQPNWCETFRHLCSKPPPGHMTTDAKSELLSRFMNQSETIYWHPPSDPKCYRDWNLLNWVKD